MAKLCVQCDKKIGLFASAIDGIYCSYECRDGARRDIAENQKRAAEAAVEAERAAVSARADALAQSARDRAESQLRSTCPKCGSGWRLTARATPEGADVGACERCSFTIEFSAIEKCPNCTCMSMVVSASGARCPRCKYRKS